MSMPDRLETELTKKLGIRYPIMCAGKYIYIHILTCKHTHTNFITQ